MKVEARDIEDEPIRIEPVVYAMVRILISQQEKIAEQARGQVCLHYSNETDKVHAEITEHLGFLKFK